ncbi:MAG: glycosyltransferase family 4 protein, partial [Deltaproteobacteria bacterium]|nr:glycosyltransferase family 4 protein [Deltaproteobacteria bacterium]
MKISINALPLLDPLTGVGNYIYQLIKHFNLLPHLNEYTYYYGYFTERPLGNKFIYQIKKFLRGIPILGPNLRGATRILSRFQFKDFDIYFEPNFIPLNISAKKIVTTVHDFSFLLYPEAHPKDRIDYFSKHFFRNITRSDAIITVSHYIKAEALNVLKSSATMITAIHLGVDHSLFKTIDKSALANFRRGRSLPENFILFVGNIEPRKNLRRLLHAYLRLPGSIKEEFKLVLIGPEGWKNEEVREILERTKHNTIYLPYMDAQQLSYVYNLAAVFVFPSLYEGFGLPPLEAMACGCPAVVSKASSLPEVCGDAGHY